MRILDRIDQTVRIFTGILMGVMTLLVLIQVFWRYALNSPLGAPLELSIMCMVWIAMLGTATAVRTKSHIAVGILVDLMPGNMKRAAQFFGYAVMIVVFYLVATEGWTVVLRAMRQRSTITGIPQGYVALAVPACGALSILYVIEQAWANLQGGSKPKPNAAKEADGNA